VIASDSWLALAGYESLSLCSVATATSGVAHAQASSHSGAADHSSGVFGRGHEPSRRATEAPPRPPPATIRHCVRGIRVAAPAAATRGARGRGAFDELFASRAIGLRYVLEGVECVQRDQARAWASRYVGSRRRYRSTLTTRSSSSRISLARHGVLPRRAASLRKGRERIRDPVVSSSSATRSS